MEQVLTFKYGGVSHELIKIGFDTTKQGGHFQVYGVDGINLAELWGDSPSAYYSKSIAMPELETF
jgi:hypothetical protein